MQVEGLTLETDIWQYQGNVEANACYNQEDQTVNDTEAHDGPFLFLSGNLKTQLKLKHNVNTTAYENLLNAIKH